MADTLDLADPDTDPGTPEAYEPVDTPVADGRVWIDLLNPGPDELKKAHLACGLRIPTREDLSEIESSSRHFVEKGALYLSTPLVTHAESREPELTPVGFIVTRERLVTIRFDDLKAFDVAHEQMDAQPATSGLEAFTLVMEAVIDRKADLLEQQGTALEELSKEVFNRPENKRRDSNELRQLLRRVGEFGDRSSKMRGSLLTIGRVLPFVMDTSDGKLPKALAHRLKAARGDVASLTAYQENLTGRVQFLLDATLGLINIDQNDVFKILTVVSAVGVPPTLVASIYGMNFKMMPELEWRYGYPLGLAVILISGLAPLWWFRKKGWF